MEEHNERLTTGLSTVYLRDIEHSSFLVADPCNEAYVSFVNLAHARHVREFKTCLGKGRITQKRNLDCLRDHSPSLFDHLSNPKPEHITGGTGQAGAQRRGGRRRRRAAGCGGARRGREGWRWVDAPKTAAGRCAQEITYNFALPRALKNNRPGQFFGSTDKGNPHAADDRLTTGLTTGARRALRSWLLANESVPSF